MRASESEFDTEGLERTVERALALAVFALPLLYGLTEHSRNPVFWRYSAKLMVVILGYGAFYWLLVRSYRWDISRPLVAARTFGVLAGFSLLLAGVVSEFVLAVLDSRPDVETVLLRGSEPNPDTGYAYIANHEQQLVGLEGSTRWRTNSLGLRADREYGSKPDGLVRILGLGDSFTVSLSTSLAEAWPGALEALLNAEAGSPRAFEVVNAGHQGWGTRQHATWMRNHGANLEPDIVLVAMTPNDIADNAAPPPGAFTAVDGYLTRRGRDERDRSHFERRQLWYVIPGHLERTRVWKQLNSILFGARINPEWVSCQSELDDRGRRLHDVTEELLLDIRDSAEGQGARLGLILLTFQWQLGELPPGYDPGLFSERWIRFAREHDIPVADLYPVVTSLEEPQSLFWRWDYHYNALGESLVADAAHHLVRDELLGAPALFNP